MRWPNEGFQGKSKAPGGGARQRRRGQEAVVRSELTPLLATAAASISPLHPDACHIRGLLCPRRPLPPPLLIFVSLPAQRVSAWCSCSGRTCAQQAQPLQCGPDRQAARRVLRPHHRAQLRAYPSAAPVTLRKTPPLSYALMVVSRRRGAQDGRAPPSAVRAHRRVEGPGPQGRMLRGLLRRLGSAWARLGQAF